LRAEATASGIAARGVPSRKRSRSGPREARQCAKKAHGREDREPSKMIPAMTYFRTFRHYHRPKELNGRVRNGNECFLPGKVTGKRARGRRTSRRVLNPKRERSSGIRRRRPGRRPGAIAPDTQKRSLAFETLERDRVLEQRIKVVKYSPVSTGQLRRLLALHHQPINLVVFQGAFGPKSNETLSWGWLRAYMLSALIQAVR
jgi:hypothetical protein